MEDSKDTTLYSLSRNWVIRRAALVKSGTEVDILRISVSICQLLRKTRIGKRGLMWSWETELGDAIGHTRSHRSQGRGHLGLDLKTEEFVSL